MAVKVASRRLVSTANDVGTSNSATIMSKFPQTFAIEFGWKEKRFDSEATIPLLKRKPANSNRAALCTNLIVRLELVLGLDSPPALQSQRLALQVKQLKDRFKSAVTVTAETAGERLLAWCAMAGVCAAADRPRVERIFVKCARSAP